MKSMKRKELMELDKRSLVNKIFSLYANYQKASYHYRLLKADLLIIKKQLNRILENIQIAGSNNKANAIISYYNGGRLRRHYKIKSEVIPLDG